MSNPDIIFHRNPVHIIHANHRYRLSSEKFFKKEELKHIRDDVWLTRNIIIQGDRYAYCSDIYDLPIFDPVKTIKVDFESTYPEIKIQPNMTVVGFETSVNPDNNSQTEFFLILGWETDADFVEWSLGQ